MGGMSNLKAFSTYRLGGEPVPADLKVLLAHADLLAELTGIELNWKKLWSPWLDTSYLSESDRANPDIAANVRAIAEVCGMVAFIAAHEDGEYLGFWRGAGKRSVAHSPLVRLDNEGQFSFCGGASFAEALLAQAGDEQFDEMREWLKSIGVVVRVAALKDIRDPKEKSSPDKLHKTLYRRYLSG